jgi:hypothetical protein
MTSCLKAAHLGTWYECWEWCRRATASRGCRKPNNDTPVARWNRDPQPDPSMASTAYSTANKAGRRLSVPNNETWAFEPSICSSSFPFPRFKELDSKRRAPLSWPRTSPLHWLHYCPICYLSHLTILVLSGRPKPLVTKDLGYRYHRHRASQNGTRA